jgi:hypothetical protein
MSTIDPQICVDHYNFWTTEVFGVQQRVQLKGQFDETPLEYLLSQVNFIGNPVKKERPGHETEDIHHPKVHLLAYDIVPPPPPPPPTRTVRIRNQFTGDAPFTWELGPPHFLLVPARKALLGEPTPETPPPPRVDHYLCYDAKGPEIKDQEVFLTDQFATVVNRDLVPLFLGVPVDKNGEGILHPDVHLAIYTLVPPNPLPAPITVQTKDQLQAFDQLQVFENVWLGVPSLKEWKR